MKPYVSESQLEVLTGTKIVFGCPNAPTRDAYHLHTINDDGSETCPDNRADQKRIEQERHINEADMKERPT